MNNCVKCGHEIHTDNVLCPNCLAEELSKSSIQPTINTSDSVDNNNGDSRSFGWATFGFLLAPLSLIWYLYWANTKPERAKSIGIGSAWGLLIYAFTTIIF